MIIQNFCLMKSKISTVLKYSLAVLFLYAGSYKISNVSLFRSQMFESPLLPEKLVPFIAVALPCFELCLGLFLLFADNFLNILYRISFSLMLSFTVYLIMLYTMYSKPPCACGGILSGMSYPVHIAFNILFTIAALISIKLNPPSNEDKDNH